MKNRILQCASLVLVVSIYSSCSHPSRPKMKKEARDIASLTEKFGNEVGNRFDEAEVSKYLQTMKAIGSDGSIEFTSVWKKNSFFNFNNSKGHIDEVKNLVKQYQANFDNKIIESKILLEEKDVCSKYEIYNSEELNYKKSKINTSSYRLQLSTTAAASEAGLFAGSGIIGTFGKSFAGFKGLAQFSANASFSDSYNLNEETYSEDKVDYFYAKRNVTCTKFEKFSRAKLTLTPDIISLHPQKSAGLIYVKLMRQLDNLEWRIDSIASSLNSSISNPKFDLERLKEEFGQFTVTQLIADKQIDISAGLELLSKDLLENINQVDNSLKFLKQNSIINENFNDHIGSITEKLNELKNILTSLENQKMALMVNGVKKVFLNENQIALLQGTKKEITIRNYTEIFPPLSEILKETLATGRIIKTGAEASSLIGKRRDEIKLIEKTQQMLLDEDFHETQFSVWMADKYCGGYAVTGAALPNATLATAEELNCINSKVKKYADFNQFMLKRGCLLSKIKNDGITYLCAPESKKSEFFKYIQVD